MEQIRTEFLPFIAAVRRPPSAGRRENVVQGRERAGSRAGQRQVPIMLRQSAGRGRGEQMEPLFGSDLFQNHQEILLHSVWPSFGVVSIVVFLCFFSFLFSVFRFNG